MINMKEIIFAVTFFLIFVFAMQLVNALGLSVLPALIRVGNLTRGQQFSITITTYNPDNVEETFSILVDNKIAGWVSFYYPENLSSQISQITIPANSSRDIIANFNIPKDAPNGLYLSTIYIGGSGVNQTENTNSLSIKIPISVSLEVAGLQSLSGKVLNITTADTEINRILRIETEFQNTGEIVATPAIEVSIKKNDVEIANFMSNNTSINAGSTSTIDAEWDTTGQNVGDYVATVDVYLNNSLINESNLKFKILERGTLTAEGKIEGVTASSQVETGQPTKIEVQFQNTGQIDLMAKISGEVYLNSNLVDTLNGDETLVKVGGNETLTAYFKPTQSGNYSIKGNVAFEGKKEPLSDITINAIGNPTSNVSGGFIFDTQSSIIILFVVFAFALIIIGIITNRSKKSRK
jgi:hypothetical protein